MSNEVQPNRIGLSLKLPGELLVMHQCIEHPVFQSLHLLAGNLEHHDLAFARLSYAEFLRDFIAESELNPHRQVGNAWQNFVLEQLLNAPNLLAQKCRDYPAQPLSAGMELAATSDLRLLQHFYQLDFEQALAILRTGFTHLPDPADFSTAGTATRPPEIIFFDAKQKIAQLNDWSDALPVLLDFWRDYDDSPYARHYAFRWQSHGLEATARLEPVLKLDTQRLDTLIGYDKERAKVVANTEKLLAGLPAQNVLLYGARGTGKSSTVKALLNRYAPQGLRLIEVNKQNLSDYQEITRLVGERPEKFILFVDDLSFEPDEHGYKDLKALLEGSIEAHPPNLVIYATSNRRHLIKEEFADNAPLGNDEVNAWDTVEEKLSLSDRFGLIVTFLSPNQTQYLAIVDGLAQQAGINMEQEELHRRALRWELSHSGRSGRVARQFVDFVVGELGLERLAGRE